MAQKETKYKKYMIEISKKAEIRHCMKICGCNFRCVLELFPALHVWYQIELLKTINLLQFFILFFNFSYKIIIYIC